MRFSGTGLLVVGMMVGWGMAGRTAQAQRMATAERGAQVAVFGGFTYEKQDYYSGNIPHSLGWTAGGELNLRPLWKLFSPGLEMRVMRTDGTGPYAGSEALTEYAGGLRLQVHLGRLQPYGGLLLGHGAVHYPQPLVTSHGTFTGDTALVWNALAGVDYGLTRHWGVRAELMEQYWNTDSLTFAPWGVTVGVRYRIFEGGVRAR